MQYITDLNETLRLSSHEEPVYKPIGVDEDGNGIAVPVYSLRYGFYDTVEGCTLSHFDCDTCNAARKVFDGFTNEEKRKSSFSPKDGEFVSRARFWSGRLKPVLTRKQYHIVMCAILHWFINIKGMREMQEGRAAV